VNETLHTSFESADYDTMGRFVLSRLGRAPEPGDTIEEEGYQLRVDEVDGVRVVTVVAAVRKSEP
jgi:CBS domain containing-hemolysin-like protein